MSLKRQKRESDTDDTPPSKKAKLNQDEVDDNSMDIMANLDLDLNIVIGRNKTPINLNFYSQKMKEIQIDSHIYFQFNPHNDAHNMLWKNKVLLHKSVYLKYQHLISKRNPKYCHFHQPSPKQILEMYKMAPVTLQQSQSCCTILYNIHKSIMSTINEDSYRRRNRRELQKELTNLNIPNIQNIRFLNMIQNKNKQPIQINNSNQQKSKSNKLINDFLEIDTLDSSSNINTNPNPKTNININKTIWTDIIQDYGFKQNIFHQLSLKHRISPILLIRDYLKLNFAVTGNTAKSICIMLARKSHKTNMSAIKDNISRLYHVNISIPILNSIFFAVVTDCIRGYNQKIAWFGWNDKIIQSQNEILCAMFNKCKGTGGHFLEHTLLGKLRAIIAKINEKITNEQNKIKILNESEQKLKIAELKRDKINLYKQMNSGDGDLEVLGEREILQKIGWFDPPTPDLLLNRPVMINGTFIYWMDAKNFMVSHFDKLKYKKIMKQVSKYNKAFGNGAIVCLGFVKQHMKFKQNVMLLDASYWRLKA